MNSSLPEGQALTLSLSKDFPIHSSFILLHSNLGSKAIFLFSCYLFYLYCEVSKETELESKQTNSD